MYDMVCVQFEIYSENRKRSLISKVENAHVNFKLRRPHVPRSKFSKMFTHHAIHTEGLCKLSLKSIQAASVEEITCLLENFLKIKRQNAISPH